MFLILKLILLGMGALYLLVAWNEYKRVYPFFLRIYGKEASRKLGQGMSRAVLFATGGVLCALALIWIF